MRTRSKQKTYLTLRLLAATGMRLQSDIGEDLLLELLIAVVRF